MPSVHQDINIDELSLAALEPARLLRKDLREAASGLTTSEAKYLVDMYYNTQLKRIRAGNQLKTFSEIGEPNALVKLTFESFRYAEHMAKSALDVYSLETVPGQWLRSIHGIGPVIAAGLLAHIDLNPWHCEHKSPKGKGCTKAKPHVGMGCGKVVAHTVGHLWRYAGLDPTVTWKKESQRPWNADLKVLCWKAGQSFMKLRGNPKDIYGKLYVQRKTQEVAKNVAGEFATQAADILKVKRFRKDTIARECYERGVLPDAHIDARARRWVVKLFLSHYHHVAYEAQFGTPPPKPYAIGQLGHAHLIAPPNWPMI